MKSLVTFMNSLMSCILKSESIASSNTIYSVSQGNSRKKLIEIIYKQKFSFFLVNFAPESEGHKTF